MPRRALEGLQLLDDFFNLNEDKDLFVVSVPRRALEGLQQHTTASLQLPRTANVSVPRRALEGLQRFEALPEPEVPAGPPMFQCPEEH